jgi:hypothetical protein
VHADAFLEGRGAGQVGVVLVLLDGQHGGVGVVDAGLGEQRGGPAEEEGGALVGRDR